jgi:hypothetical protein
MIYKNNSHNLEYILGKIIYYELCEIAYKNNSSNLKYVSKKNN